jgi:hypothetical protein
MFGKTNRKKTTQQKRCNECPVCEGRGKLTDMELFQYLRWAQLVNTKLDQVDEMNAAFAKYVLSDGASLLLNKDDENFLEDLNITPE